MAILTKIFYKGVYPSVIYTYENLKKWKCPTLENWVNKLCDNQWLNIMKSFKMVFTRGWGARETGRCLLMVPSSSYARRVGPGDLMHNTVMTVNDTILYI